MSKGEKGKGGRPPVELDERQKQLVLYYARNGVPTKHLAELLGISRSAFYNILRRDPEVYALYRQGVLLANVAVSNWLFESCKPVVKQIPLIDADGNQVIDPGTGEPKFYEQVVQRGSIEAQKFWLRTRAGWKDRFYIEHTPPVEDDDLDELEILPDEDIRTIVEIGRKLEGLREEDREEISD